MIVIREGGARKKKEKKDTWYWRCPKCHTIGLHEDGDSYTECGSEWSPFEQDIKMWLGFKCPICGHSIKDNKPFNKLIARIIAFFISLKEEIMEWLSWDDETDF